MGDKIREFSGPVLIVAVVITAIIAGTAGYYLAPRGEGTVDEEEPTIHVMAVWSGGEQEAFEEVLEYASQETGYDYEYMPVTTDELRSRTLMDYEAGTTSADIVNMAWPARINSDAESDHLTPVGDVWSEEEHLVDSSLVEYNGELYGIPFKMDVKPGFWYRESFFEEHNLEEPETYNEFVNLLEEISQIEGVDAPLASGNGDGWPLSDVTEAFILRQEDGDQLQQNLIQGGADFTDPRIEEALEELRDLLTEEYWSELEDFGTQYEYFWDGERPLYFMGSWTPAFPAVEDPDDLGVFPLPGVNALVGNINWLTIPAYSTETEAAKEFASAIVSAEGQARWAEEGGFIGTNADLTADDYQHSIMPYLADLGEQYGTVTDLDDGVGDPFQTEFWSELKSFWNDPEGTDLDAMIERLDSELQEARES